MNAVGARPVAKMVVCPVSIWSLLNGAARCIDCNKGENVFFQSANCLGLYIAVSGQFMRQTEWLKKRLTLGMVSGGGLLDLAAVLGDGRHTFTVSAKTSGSVLLLPVEALNLAYERYPQLRMRLLEELAREVSRAYDTCFTHTARARRGKS